MLENSNMIKRYYKANTTFPNYTNGLIYEEDLITKTYPHLFEYLHSLKRFDILCGLVGNDDTYMTLNNEMYVDFYNAGHKVIATEIKDRFKGTIYRIGDLVSYTNENQEPVVSKIKLFGFGVDLDIVLEDYMVISDLSAIKHISDIIGFYDNGQPILETSDKLYVLRFDPQKPQDSFLVKGSPSELRYDLKTPKGKYFFDNLTDAVIKEMMIKPSLNIQDIIDVVSNPNEVKTLKYKALVKNNITRPNIDLENILN